MSALVTNFRAMWPMARIDSRATCAFTSVAYSLRWMLLHAYCTTIFELHVHVVLNKASLNGHNISSVGPITFILWFSESLGRGLLDDVLKSKVYFLPVFDKIPWPYCIGNYGPFQIWDLSIIPSERAPSKLSETVKFDTRTLVTEPTLVLSKWRGLLGTTAGITFQAFR